MRADPTRRFSDRVADYVRSRPGYPAGLIDVLREHAALRPDHRVADVGSGTGLLSRLFLDHGNRVYAIEPNPEMREAAERLFAAEPRFVSVVGRAEATTLPAASVDLVAAGQAFHWFAPHLARAEFLRVLRPGRPALLVWNDRDEEASPFMAGYEALLRRHGTDYRAVHHRRFGESEIAAFYGHADYLRSELAHRQDFDWPGLQARLRSSSYVPAAGQPGHVELISALRALFEAHRRGSTVAFEYRTRIYLARPVDS